MKKTILKLIEDDIGTRIDTVIAEREKISRSAGAKLVESGMVLVNSQNVAKNYKIRENDVIEVFHPEVEAYDVEAQDIPLDIVYEDDDIIVINKKKGMVVHPAAGNPDGTLVNALLYHCGDSLSGIGGVARPGIVHRIDKDTSGLLVVAKNDKAHVLLSEQLKSHEVNRVYHAIVIGNLRELYGTVDAPIGRHPVDRKKMAVIKNEGYTSRDAVTHYRVIKRFNGFDYIQCVLETGRTHQIRVHMAYLGHPLLGDEVYGGAKTRFQSLHKDCIHGQCLHAKELHLTHPTTNMICTFTSELPDDFKRVLDLLEKTCT
ncbi:MAG: RluA family pseudouridine synthase [Clostridia bacterium]|nr:RluA family pseudouridine synthase [Clostridia bacterium]